MQSNLNKQNFILFLFFSFFSIVRSCVLNRLAQIVVSLFCALRVLFQKQNLSKRSHRVPLLYSERRETFQNYISLDISDKGNKRPSRYWTSLQNYKLFGNRPEAISSRKAAKLNQAIQATERKRALFPKHTLFRSQLYEQLIDKPERKEILSDRNIFSPNKNSLTLPRSSSSHIFSDSDRIETIETSPELVRVFSVSKSQESSSSTTVTNQISKDFFDEKTYFMMPADMLSTPPSSSSFSVTSAKSGSKFVISTTGKKKDRNLFQNKKVCLPFADIKIANYINFNDFLVCKKLLNKRFCHAQLDEEDQGHWTMYWATKINKKLQYLNHPLLKRKRKVNFGVTELSTIYENVAY